MKTTMTNLINDKRSLYNPFNYIAGYPSLVLGLLLIILTSVIGSYSGVYFPGVVDSKIGFEGSFFVHLSISLISWLSMVVVFYPLSLILSGPKVRFIDIAGTQALARFPMLIASLLGFIDILKKVTDYVLYISLERIQELTYIEIKEIADPGVVATWEFIAAGLVLIAMIITTIWMITLMYNAYKVSSNLKGGKLAISFIIGIFIAQVISNMLVFRYLGII